MNIKIRDLFIVLVAIVAGYASLIFFLGSEGSSLAGDQAWEDILPRRNFLIRALQGKNSPADFFLEGSSQYAGEWTVGTYAMATYALTNIAMIKPETARESSDIIAKWIESITSPGMTSFDEAAWGEKPLDSRVLQGDEGHIGYYGHINLMLGCYALLNNDGEFRELHKLISDAIERRMRKYPHRHVETYPGETYPPDNTVAAASLKVADMTLNSSYRQTVDEWIRETKKLEYPSDGLLVFQIDIRTGEPLQTSRGTNIAWNSFFLPLVDEDYAHLQYTRFKKHMLRRIFGFAGFKEYSRGGWFKSDVDTGPVIFGISASATGFAVAGAKREKDAALLTDLLRSVELIAVSGTKGDEKRYLVSPVVGDAIMLATKTACRWKPVWRN